MLQRNYRDLYFKFGHTVDMGSPQHHTCIGSRGVVWFSMIVSGIRVVKFLKVL